MWLQELEGTTRIQAKYVVSYDKVEKNSLRCPISPEIGGFGITSEFEMKYYHQQVDIWKEENEITKCYLVKTITGDTFYTLDNPEKTFEVLERNNVDKFI